MDDPAVRLGCDLHHPQPHNDVSPVPVIQGKAKSGKKKANPIVSGTSGADQKVNHTEKPISKAYSVPDTDLVRDNLENDILAADLNDI